MSTQSIQERVRSVRDLTPEARDMLEEIITLGHPLPSVITERSVRHTAKLHNISTHTSTQNAGGTGFASLSPEALRVLDEITAKGYPMPAEISNSALIAEGQRIRALESYAENVML